MSYKNYMIKISFRKNKLRNRGQINGFILKIPFLPHLEPYYGFTHTNTNTAKMGLQSMEFESVFKFL